MKPLSMLALSTSLLAAFAFTSSALAEHHQGKAKHCDGKNAYKEARIAEFDKDGDGKLSNAEKEAAKAARFQEIDIDGSGGLTSDELAMYREFKKEERRSKKKACRFDKLDVDNSGTISLEEFASAEHKMHRAKYKKKNGDKSLIKAMHSERVEEFDLDGDGKLSDTEKLASRTARFEAADLNADGQLTAEEMESYRSSSREEMKVKIQAKRFERMDKNGDGVASLEEFVNSGKMKKNWN